MNFMAFQANSLEYSKKNSNDLELRMDEWMETIIDWF